MLTYIIYFSAFLLIFGAKYYGFLKFLITGDYNDRYKISRRERNEQVLIDTVLNENFRYYANLSPQGKNRFLARLSYVMKRVQFVGYAGLQITDEMRICVLFSQIQLTFGLNLFHLQRFKRYILYPESFYSRFFDRNLLGLTSGFGFVTLSWRDFQQGYLVPNDKYNLGLHEMAHALRLDLLDNGEPDSMLQILSDQMDKKSLYERNMASRGVPSILRDYAFVNNEEFFSVCVEYFFEVPDLLKQHKPEIFMLLCKLLNQNPLNTTLDYKLS